MPICAVKGKLIGIGQHLTQTGKTVYTVAVEKDRKEEEDTDANLQGSP